MGHVYDIIYISQTGRGGGGKRVMIRMRNALGKRGE